MTAEYKVHGAVAVITLNNPPVNGLGHATRTAIVEGMKRALDDDAVKAVVLTGAGKAFSGGADIREFNSPKALAEPTQSIQRRAFADDLHARRLQRLDQRAPAAQANLVADAQEGIARFALLRQPGGAAQHAQALAGAGFNGHQLLAAQIDGAQDRCHGLLRYCHATLRGPWCD